MSGSTDPKEPVEASESEEMPFLPADPQSAATVQFLRERFADDLDEVSEYRGEVTVVVHPEAILAICGALAMSVEPKYNFLADLTAVDWQDREPRYDVVYHLLSLQTRAVLRLKTRVGGEDVPDPAVSTVTPVWAAANFYEREVFDLFGIRFTGHPNMTRILMPSDWVGYPLRKDYPLTGIHLPDPHWGGQVPLDQALPMGTGQQTLRTPDRTQAPLVTRGPGIAVDNDQP